MWSWTKHRGTTEIRSLIERLKAVEAGGDPAMATSFSTPTAHRCPDLLRWFGVGFACAWVGGGVSLLAMLFVHPADAKPRFGAREPVLLRSGVTSEASRALGGRTLWWKLPLSIERTGAKLAQRD
jgi:hypothetical protein